MSTMSRTSRLVSGAKKLAKDPGVQNAATQGLLMGGLSGIAVGALSRKKEPIEKKAEARKPKNFDAKTFGVTGKRTFVPEDAKYKEIKSPSAKKGMSGGKKALVGVGAAGVLSGLALRKHLKKEGDIEKQAARKPGAKSKLTMKSEAIKAANKAKVSAAAAPKPSIMNKIRGMSGRNKMIAGAGAAGAIGGLAAYKATRTKKD